MAYEITSPITEATYEKEISNLAMTYLEQGRDFDVVHVIRGLDVLADYKDELEPEVYKLLWISFALHDIGYSLLPQVPHGYVEIMDKKVAHAIEGEAEVRRLLEQPNFTEFLDKDQIEVICYLVRHHDEVESIVDYEFNGFAIGRFLMSLDTLGAFIAVADGKGTFSEEDRKKYLEKEVPRRGSRIHQMLAPVLNQTIEKLGWEGNITLSEQ